MTSSSESSHPGSDVQEKSPGRSPVPSIISSQNGTSVLADEGNIHTSTIAVGSPHSHKSSNFSNSPPASPADSDLSLEGYHSRDNPMTVLRETSGSMSVAVRPPLPASASRNVPPVPKFNAEAPSISSNSLPPHEKMRATPPVPKFWSSSEEQPKGLSVPQAVPPLATPSEMIQPASQSLVDEKLSASELNTGLKLGGSQEKAGEEAEPLGLVTPLCEEKDNTSHTLVEKNSSAVSGKETLTAANGKEDVRPAAAAGGSQSQPPYVKPPWSAAPGEAYSLEVLKEGTILGNEDVSKKGAYMFGRSDRCDFVLEHPTVSRYHAVLQYNAMGESFIYDLGSTHGTFVNKTQVKGKEYVPLRVGDIIRFGLSSRLHAFQGPLERMPKEGLSRKERETQRLVGAAQDRSIREASMMRGKMDARMSDGISWGMDEDAEEEEEDTDEVTWQTFKGQLTERQEKTLDKVRRHNEKLSNLKKENDAIQAKEMSQGGLTQGQQTQVARNDLRMAQLLEELESMEETLNESIRESISGRAGKPRRRKNTSLYTEDEEDDLSDDEFYDRASKMQQKKKEAVQRVETTDSLLDKKAALSLVVESLSQAIKEQQEKAAKPFQEPEAAQTPVGTEDSLDQFMTTVTSTIMTDTVSQLQKELEPVLKEMEHVERLLKISDPTGDGLRKWTIRQSVHGSKGSATDTSAVDKRVLPREDDAHQSSSLPFVEIPGRHKGASSDILSGDGKEVARDPDTAVRTEEGGNVLPPLEPPLRLGAPMPEAPVDQRVEISKEVEEAAAKLVGYKDRKKNAGIGMENLPIGRDAHKAEPRVMQTTEEELVVDEHVADSVALLLRHKRGLVETEDDALGQKQNKSSTDVQSKSLSNKRKKQGARNLDELTDTSDVDNWVPPAGQTGDGRTALNDKYGY